MFDLQDSASPPDVGAVAQSFGSAVESGSSTASDVFPLVFGLTMMVFGFVLSVVWMTNRAKGRAERLRVMEESLRSERLDAEAKAELVTALTGKTAESSGRRMLRVIFGVGWMAMMLGVMLLFADDREMWQSGLVVGGAGLALLTLPVALREFDRSAPDTRPGREAS